MELCEIPQAWLVSPAVSHELGEAGACKAFFRPGGMIIFWVLYIISLYPTIFLLVVPTEK
jgi:hypothetical protein